MCVRGVCVIDWVLCVVCVHVVARDCVWCRRQPKTPKPAFPPGAFDFLKPENQGKIRAEKQKVGHAIRASG